MNLQIIILAAGRGKRMYSNTPKVLHQLAGKSLLAHVVETAQALNPKAIHVVYGHQGEEVKAAFAHSCLNWVYQEKQLGTGHALACALPYIPDEAQVLVLYGDVPLISAKTLKALLNTSTLHQQALSLLVAHYPDPSALGRVVRNKDGAIIAVVEEKDATRDEKKITEIYSGICTLGAKELKNWLPRLSNNNAQGEYYLTEIITLAVKEEVLVSSRAVEDNNEVQGVNDKLQLQQLERSWQRKAAERLLREGVTIADAERFDLRGELHCGKDVFIDVNCVFLGNVTLGDGCIIGPNCIIADSTIDAHVDVQAHSLIEGSTIGPSCQVGPFARLRAGTRLGSQCKIGNFVETKKAHFDEYSKASHLSYLGDVTIGKHVNIGAGTITCNYDGVNKHQTIIEDGAFIGSDTQLIAPVTVGANATIGAGSTIRKDAPPEALTLSASGQKSFLGWKRPLKKES